MMEKLRDVLVTDRTPADVAARNGKGTYNEADLNRVLRACSWLAVNSKMRAATSSFSLRAAEAAKV